ncbi:MAG: hypothetical protein IT536_17095 [Hyphomicrobiales bacterium]|nr:hypothetical protein [Hyphomicrobiales bacterium]
MRRHLILWALSVALAAPAAAQQWPELQAPPPVQSKPKPKAKAPPRDDVEELTPGQIRRAQELEPGPGSPKSMPEAVKRPAKTAAQTRQIECRGAFARDSSHIRLAQVFGPDNVTYTEVEGPENSKLMASVLFPRDPQRRLEVLWSNPTSRAGTQVIAINGKSAWAAPRGIKLGTSLAAIEKLNGKPFKISGFGREGSTAASWEDGAMMSLQGGCTIGMRFIADPRAPEDARQQVAAAKELSSNDPSVRAVRPVVAEILIGY